MFPLCPDLEVPTVFYTFLYSLLKTRINYETFPELQFPSRKKLILFTCSLVNSLMDSFGFSPSLHSIIFKNHFMVVEQFEIHSKTERKLQRFPTYPLPPPTCIASRIINILHLSVTIDESMLMHHNYPMSIVCLRVHSWWCIFYEFGQRYNDIYSSL